jgi:hypothetical protein
MTVQRFARWWSLGALVAVLVVMTWTYVDAHAAGRLPLHHPWPAMSVTGLAVIPLMVPVQQKTWVWIYRITASAFAVVMAIVVHQITMPLR